MRILPSINLTSVARLSLAWALVFAVVHAYWAAGGAAGMNGEPADTSAEEGYIAFITVLGLLGAAVAHGLSGASLAARRRRALVGLARAGGAALLAGVVVGSGRWLVDGSLNGDGLAGIVTTAYFFAGGVLFSMLGWADSRRRSRPGRPRTQSPPYQRDDSAAGGEAPA